MGKNEDLPISEHHAPPSRPSWCRRVILWLLAVTAVLLTLQKLQVVNHVRTRCHKGNGLRPLISTGQKPITSPSCQSPECIHAALGIRPEYCPEPTPQHDQCRAFLTMKFGSLCVKDPSHCMDLSAQWRASQGGLFALLDGIKTRYDIDHPLPSGEDIGNVAHYLAGQEVIALASVNVVVNGVGSAPPNFTVSAPPAIGMPTKEDYKDEKLMNYYEGTIGRIFQRLQLSSQPIPRKIIHFEQKLAAASPSPEDWFDVKKYQLATWSEAVDPELPHISYMLKAFQFPSAYPIQIIRMAPQYLKDLKTILGEAEPEVIRAYFYWKAIQAYGPFVGQVDKKTFEPLKKWNEYIAGRN